MFNTQSFLRAKIPKSTNKASTIPLQFSSAVHLVITKFVSFPTKIMPINVGSAIQIKSEEFRT